MNYRHASSIQQKRDRVVACLAKLLCCLRPLCKPQEFTPEPGASEFVHRIDARQFTEAKLLAMV